MGLPWIFPCWQAIGVRPMIQLHDSPQAAVDRTKTLGVLLLIECDFGLYVHGGSLL